MVWNNKKIITLAEYILRSILYPNAEIAAGYESVVLVRKDGSSAVGVLKSEDADALVLASPEEGQVRVPKAELASRVRGLSPMPEGMGELMTKRELRDLVAALSQ